MQGSCSCTQGYRKFGRFYLVPHLNERAMVLALSYIQIAHNYAHRVSE